MTKAAYIESGIELDLDRNELRVDLSEARTIKIIGERREGKPLEYFLKITQTGKLCLV